MAIDGSAKLSDRRHAQNAADTAALAGAFAKVEGDPQWKLASLDIALINGYNSDLVSNTVDVYSCDEIGSKCGPYAGEQDIVKVLITSNVNTYFARVIGIDQTHNMVEAFAMSQEEYSGELYNGASIVGLAPDECETIYFSGDAEPTITGGGVYSNSKKDCGVRIQGSTHITMDNSLTMVANGYTKNGNPPLGARGVAAGARPAPGGPPVAEQAAPPLA